MQPKAQGMMRLSHIGSETHRLSGNSRSLVALLDTQIEPGDSQQALGIASEFYFDILRSPECGGALTTQIEIQWNLRDHAREQLLRRVCRGQVNCQHQLLDSASAVATL